MSPHLPPEPTASDNRDLAAADLHALLHRTVVAAFLTSAPEVAGRALTVAATPGSDLRIVVDLDTDEYGHGTWGATQAGRLLAGGRIAPPTTREIAEGAMHAIVTALNAEPADARPLLALIGMRTASAVCGLCITRTCDTLSFGLRDADGRVVWRARRVLELDAAHALQPDS